MINNINQSLFVFFVSGCKCCQYCSIRSVPLAVIKFLIIFMFIELLIKKLFQSCSAGTGFTPMHLLLLVLQTIFLIRSLYVKSQSIASTSSTTFWWVLQTQTEWVIFEPARTNTLGFKTELWEPNTYIWVFFFLKQYIILASYKDFCKLQSFWLCSPLITLT